MFPSREEVKALRKRYPVGTRVVVDRMGDDPRPVPPGTGGMVVAVDDAGTVHCLFDGGRLLGLVPGEDSFHAVSPERKEERGWER